jgi:hypothetical protein
MRVPTWALQTRFVVSLGVAVIVAAYGWTVYSKLRAQQFAAIQQQQQPNVAFETFRLFAVAFVATYTIMYLSERLRAAEPATTIKAMRGGGELSLDDVMRHVDLDEPPF